MGDPTLMQLQATERFRTFDVGSFVSYQTDEDVTPTEAELVEEIPQHLMPVGPSEEEIAAKAAKPRRGKAYLRTEIDESPKPDAKSAVAPSEDDDFGAGIDDEGSLTVSAKTAATKRSGNQRSNDQPSGGDQSTPAADSDAPGRKRKRRRRKRGSGRRENDSAGSDNQAASDSDVASASVDPTNATAANATTQSVDGTNQPSHGDAAASSDSPRTGKKRRRRRRRRGGSSGENTDSGNTDSSAAPTATDTGS